MESLSLCHYPIRQSLISNIEYPVSKERGETTMKKTGAKKEERFAKKAGKTWLDPMCAPFETR